MERIEHVPEQAIQIVSGRPRVGFSRATSGRGSQGQVGRRGGEQKEFVEREGAVAAVLEKALTACKGGQRDCGGLAAGSVVQGSRGNEDWSSSRVWRLR